MWCVKWLNRETHSDTLELSAMDLVVVASLCNTLLETGAVDVRVGSSLSGPLLVREVVRQRGDLAVWIEG
jgi:hypothetical protein